MITALHIKNFKCWEDTREFRMAPITGFFGTNSSGKTSLLQLLLLLKQTVETPDRAQVLQFGGEKARVDLGTFRDTVYRQGENGGTAPLELTLTWKLPKSHTIYDPQKRAKALFTYETLQFHATIREAEKTQRLLTERFEYRFTDAHNPLQKYTFGMQHKNGDGEQYEIISEGVKPLRTLGRGWPLPSPVKCYGFPAQVGGYYQNLDFVSELHLRFEEFFGGVYYLGPLREYPRRQYLWAGDQPSDMGRRGERVIEALLASRERNEKISRGKGKKQFTLEEYVAWWLRELKLIHDFKVEALPSSNLYRVSVQKTPGSAFVLITDVGFGVSQILPVLTLCYYAPEGSTIILEQPEIHLHPAVQAGLADVFIDAVQKRKVQIILESHSELLLTRLQRRLAEGAVSREDVALYFCERETSAAHLIPLQLDLYGNIINWPKDFFGDDFGERAAMMKAALQRQGNLK